MNFTCSFYSIDFSRGDYEELETYKEIRDSLYQGFLNVVQNFVKDASLAYFKGFVSWQEDDFDLALDMAESVQEYLTDNGHYGGIGISINNKCARLASKDSKENIAVWDMDHIVENIYPKKLTWLDGFGPVTASRVANYMGIEDRDVTIEDFLNIPLFEIKKKLVNTFDQVLMYRSLRNEISLQVDMSPFPYRFLHKPVEPKGEQLSFF